ncbi:MAG: hypothetical protein KGJ86_00045 [Chloroflexota bacterium]|nr:hypothetical protein [Chloroflexota bacterium]
MLASLVLHHARVLAGIQQAYAQLAYALDEHDHSEGLGKPVARITAPVECVPQDLTITSHVEGQQGVQQATDDVGVIGEQ